MSGEGKIRAKLHALSKRVHHKKMLPNPMSESGLYDEMHILPTDESEAVGTGRKKRFVKGSPEAKAHMAKIRNMKGSGVVVRNTDYSGQGVVVRNADYSGQGVSVRNADYKGMGGAMSSQIMQYLVPLVAPIVISELHKLYAKHRGVKKRTL